MTSRAAGVNTILGSVVFMVVIVVVVLGGVVVAARDVFFAEVSVWMYQLMRKLRYDLLWFWMRLN